MIFAADPSSVAATSSAAAPCDVVVVSRDSHNDVLESSDTPLYLIKGRKSEDALFRQAISLTTTITIERPASGIGPDVLRWSYQPRLQRQLCFTSIVGQFSCAGAEVEDLPERSSGQVELAPQQRVHASGATQTGVSALLSAPALDQPTSNATAEAAHSALVVALKARFGALFEADRRLKLNPMLKAARVSIRRTTVVAALPHR